MSFLEALLTSSILQMAVLAAIGASLASGVIGSYVVVKRIASLSGSISHSVLSGIGCALFMQKVWGMQYILPLYGAIVAAVISALIIGWIYLRYQEREDAAISMIWSIGMAIGVIFVSQTPGYNVELNNYLLGNILWVSPKDLFILAILDIFIILSVIFFHKRFLALLFDEKEAELQGVSVKALFLFLLVLISLSIVVLIETVGIILVLSMLVLPAAIAEVFTGKLTRMMVVATLLNILLSIGGLAISYKLDLPPGATIALFAGFVYILSLRFKK